MTEPQDTVDRLGLKVRAQFVPFSHSRNSGEKSPSLNWKVTLVHTPAGGALLHGAPLNTTAPSRDILTTDYMAGSGHCPSYNSKPPIGYSYPVGRWQIEAPAWECENGRAATWFSWANDRGFAPKPKTKPLEPDTLDVIASLVMDSSVLDESSFEDWANSLGYDTDSRSAEAIYRACLDIALKLRNGIGEKALAELRTAFQDY